MKTMKLTIHSLPYQLVCLLNESSRREMWNVGKVVMPSVVSHNIVTSSGFGTLVLQHILEVLHGISVSSRHNVCQMFVLRYFLIGDTHHATQFLERRGYLPHRPRFLIFGHRLCEEHHHYLLLFTAHTLHQPNVRPHRSGLHFQCCCCHNPNVFGFRLQI